MASPKPTESAPFALLLPALFAWLLILPACGGDTSPREITLTRKVTLDDPRPENPHRGTMGPEAPPGPGEETADDSSPGLSWDAPEGWVQGPPRRMRLVTFTPGNRSDVECYVTTLAGAAGGVEANVNRWRGQMGQPPLPEDAIAALPRITVLDRPSPLVEVSGRFSGQSGESGEDYALLGVVCPLPSALLTVKMTGPKAAVLAEKENFLGFCRSLRP